MNLSGTDSVLVEAKSLRGVYRVSLRTLKCSCGNSGCFHSQIVEDVYFRKAKKFGYELWSALHKQIRRCEVSRALAFGKMIARANGEYLVKRYIYSILLEETRNQHLWNKRIGELTTDEWIINAASSKKKWQIKSRFGIFEDKVDAFLEAKNTGNFGATKEIHDAVEGMISTRYFFVIAWRVLIGKDKEQKQVLSNALINRALSDSASPEWTNI